MSKISDREYKALFKCRECGADKGDPKVNWNPAIKSDGYLITRKHEVYDTDYDSRRRPPSTLMHTFRYELYAPECREHRSFMNYVEPDGTRWGGVSSRSITRNDRYRNSKPAIQKSFQATFDIHMDEDVLPAGLKRTLAAFPEIEEYRAKGCKIEVLGGCNIRVHLYRVPSQLDLFRMPEGLDDIQACKWVAKHGHISYHY